MTKNNHSRKSISKSPKTVKGKKSSLKYSSALPPESGLHDEGAIRRAEGECREFFDILTEFIDSELTENHLIRIRSHLSTCLQCTRVYQDVRILIRLCQTESMDEPLGVSSQLWRVLEKRFKTKNR